MLRAHRRQVQRPGNGHAPYHHGGARAGELAVAAGLGGEVDDHAAGLHPGDHRRADDLRRGAPRHGSGADDHVDVLQVLGQAALLLGAFLVGQRAGVAALAGRGHPEVEELAAQRLDLLAGLRAHVEALDLRAQALGGGDRLQAGHAGADDQHLRRPDGAGRGGQHREEARRQLRGDQHRLVTGHARLRAEHVHRLRAGGARQAFQRERQQAAVADRRRAALVRLRLQAAHQHRAGLQPREHRVRGRLHAQHRIGLRERVLAQLGAGIGIGLVREMGAIADPGLDAHAGAGRDQLLAGFRGQRDAPLARRRLACHAHDHRHRLPLHRPVACILTKATATMASPAPIRCRC